MKQGKSVGGSLQSQLGASARKALAKRRDMETMWEQNGRWSRAVGCSASEDVGVAAVRAKKKVVVLKRGGGVPA